MNEADKDYRYMALTDLMTELQKESLSLDPDSEEKVQRHSHRNRCFYSLHLLLDNYLFIRTFKPP